MFIGRWRPPTGFMSWRGRRDRRVVFVVYTENCEIFDSFLLLFDILFAKLSSWGYRARER